MVVDSAHDNRDSRMSAEILFICAVAAAAAKKRQGAQEDPDQEDGRQERCPLQDHLKKSYHNEIIKIS